MSTRNPFAYSRTIRLAPAIGDWTTIQYRGDLEDTQISSIQNIGFNGLPKEQIHKAHLLHYRIAEGMVQQLSKDMDLNVELFTVGAAQMSFGDFWQQYSEPFVQTQLTLPGFGSAALMLDWELADAMVNRLTGGSGESSQHIEFSAVEHAILQTEMTQILGIFAQGWNHIFEAAALSPKFTSGIVEDDGKRSIREAVTVFSFQISFGKSDLKRLYCVYPSAVLRSLLNARSGIAKSVSPLISLQRRTLKNLKTEVKATLGRATLTMSELRGLQAGDIIPLDTQLVAPLELTLGSTTQFNVQGGISHHRYCVQLIFLDSPESPASFSHAPAPVSPSPPAPPEADVSVPEVVPYVAAATAADALPLSNGAIAESHEPNEAHEELEDWDSGYSAVQSEENDSEEDEFESDEEESHDEADDFDYDDEEEAEEEASPTEEEADEDQFAPQGQDSPTPAPATKQADSFPGEANETPHDEDLSWDSLDDHF